MKLGVVGLGAMGGAMAARLLAAGHHVTVYNRSVEKAAPLVADGAVLAATPAQAAASGLVLSMLTNDAAVEGVCAGADGILAGLPEGGIHVSCSTITLAAAERLAAAHTQAGRHFATATVLGRPPAIPAGQLFVMLAAPPEIRARVAPVLADLGQRVFEIGDTPSQANVLKLCANFMLFSTIEQMAEIFSICARAGLSRELVFGFLTGSLFNAPVHKNYGRLMVDRAYDGIGTDVKLALKDTAMLLAAAEALAAPMPLASLVRDKLLACIAHGEREKDFAILAEEADRGAGLA